MTKTPDPQPSPNTPIPPNGYTRVDNTIFDRLMPTLSGNGLKILLIALRQSSSCTESSSPSGHKPSEVISYSQFMAKGGMSRATVARAIRECLDAGVLLRVKNGRRHAYAVNLHGAPPESGPPTSPDRGPLAAEPPLAGSGNELPSRSESEPPTGDRPQIGSENVPAVSSEGGSLAEAKPRTGSEGKLTAGDRAQTRSKNEPEGGSEGEPLPRAGSLTSSDTEHTKEKRDVVVGGATTTILSRLKAFGLNVDQEVRELAAQYKLPQVDYALRRATRQGKRNPQGLLRTWMRSGHMPFPPPEECDCEPDKRPYQQLNADAQAFRRHQSAS
jgi:hypothetical protein